MPKKNPNAVPKSPRLRSESELAAEAAVIAAMQAHAEAVEAGVTDEALAAWVKDVRKKKKEQKAKGKAKNERQLEVDEKEMEAPVRELSRMELRIKAEFDELALRQGLVSEGYMAVAKESQEKELARLEAAEAEDKL